MFGQSAFFRFIPTHVGRISDCRKRSDADRAFHPHARGADDPSDFQHSAPSRFIPTHVGRMEAHLRPDVPVIRFIPTHVGRIIETDYRNEITAGSSPRTWGGSPCRLLRFLRCRGSSPRTWGGLMEIFRPRPFLNGSSPRTWGGCISSISSESESTVHPHARGADVSIEVIYGGTVGSSPRTWGGCISSISSESESTVHPHARGADGILPCHGAPSGTVHPHARGADTGR